MSYPQPTQDDRPMALRPVSERVTKADPDLVLQAKIWRRLSIALLSAGFISFLFWDVVGPAIGNVRSHLIAAITRRQPKPAPVVHRPIPPPEPAPAPKPIAPPTLVARPAPAPEPLPPLELAPVEFPALSTWPQLISLTTLPQIVEIPSTSDEAPHIYRSPHYEFRSRVPLGPDVVREFSRVFEATYLAVSRLPLDFRPSPERTRVRFVAELFENNAQYIEAGGLEGSAGCYKRAAKSILVPLDSLGVKILPGGRTLLERGGDANGTLIHEITHQLMNAWLPRLPLWLTEGSAEYMVVPAYLHGRFDFAQTDQRLVDLITRNGSRQDLNMLRPSELLLLDPKNWSVALAVDSTTSRENYQSALMLTYYFFHLDGKDRNGGPMTDYLREIEKGTPEIIACDRHLVRGRSADELDSDVRQALARIGLPLKLISRGGPVWKAPQFDEPKVALEKTKQP